ncbi:MAG: hypothetical protein JNK29_11875 [Anaerolineales bacterium]|nr:hypothetical protein [Anaerolineales bacterium]
MDLRPLTQVETYSVALALQDYVPVALSALGLFFLAEMIARMSAEARVGRIALLGAWLVMLGGGIKASWKLNLALTGADIHWMDNALFILMGPGFTALGWALSAAQRQWAGQPLTSRWAWLFPFLVSAAFLATAAGLAWAQPGTRTWFFVLLGMTTIANFALSGLAIRQAWGQGRRGIALLFIVNVVAILALQGFARAGDRTELVQWIEQILNTLSNLAFALAAYRLNRVTPAAAGHLAAAAARLG